MKFNTYLNSLGARIALACCILIASNHTFAWGNWYKYWKPKPLPTITEIVVQSGGEFDDNPYDYDLLLNAVLAVGIEGALNNPDSSLTLFAPTDHAFISLANDLGYQGKDEAEAFNTIVGVLTELGGGEFEEILTTVLLYHVSPEKLKIKKLFKTKNIDTLLPETTILRFGRSLIDNEPELNNPKLHYWHKVKSASNGIIYPINRVLIPVDLPSGTDQTITDLVVASGGDFDDNLYDYDLLLNAVLAAGIEGVLADPETPYTVFAPNDLAFIKLARDLGYHGKDEAEAFAFVATALTELGGGELVPILTNVLLYHVVPGSLTVKNVLESDAFSTALESASFDRKGRKLLDNDPNIRDPKIVLRASNLDAINGRVHTINRVLIPIQITD